MAGSVTYQWLAQLASSESCSWVVKILAVPVHQPPTTNHQPGQWPTTGSTTHPLAPTSPSTLLTEPPPTSKCTSRCLLHPHPFRPWHGVHLCPHRRLQPPTPPPVASSLPPPPPPTCSQVKPPWMAVPAWSAALNVPSIMCCAGGVYRRGGQLPVSFLPASQQLCISFMSASPPVTVSSSCGSLNPEP